MESLLDNETRIGTMNLIVSGRQGCLSSRERMRRTDTAALGQRGATGCAYETVLLISNGLRPDSRKEPLVIESP